MLVAAQKPNGPTWTPIMGAQVLFAPIDRGLLRRARKAALAVLKRDEAEGELSEASAAEQLEELGDALSYALIMAGARDWRDVARQIFDDAGEPVLGDDGKATFEDLPFSAENLDIVLSDPVTFDAFDAAYVMPFAARERSKNGSAASPNGIGAAATRAKGTANSRAKPRKAKGAKRAHIASRPRKTTTPI